MYTLIHLKRNLTQETKRTETASKVISSRQFSHLTKSFPMSRNVAKGEEECSFAAKVASANKRIVIFILRTLWDKLWDDKFDILNQKYSRDIMIYPWDLLNLYRQ